MQKGRVLSLRSVGVTEFLQKNSFLIILLSVLIAGIFLGVFIFDDFEIIKSYSEEYIADYISSRSGHSFWSILLSSTLECWAILFLSFLLGASMFGVVTVPALLIIKGFFQGGITSFLYSEYALKGIAFNAIVFIPSTIIFIIVLLIASRESIRFSLKLSSLTLNKTLPFSMAQDFKDYSIKYLIFAVLTLISALVDALVSVGLMKYFTL